MSGDVPPNADCDAPFTRLSVNINDDCAAHLNAMKDKGLSITEVIRQAIALHKFVQDGGRVLPPGATS